MSRPETRSEIVRIGTEIIGHSGFNATGIDTILKKAKVPKGSFYYYFPSKDDFGLAVIDRSAAEYAEKIDSYLKDEQHSPLARIRNYLEGVVKTTGSNQCQRGCLIGNLGQEMASQSEAFRKRIEEVFECWRGKFRDCLEAAKVSGELPKATDSQELAGFLLTGWQGAILRAKVMKSTTPMTEFIDVLFKKVIR